MADDPHAADVSFPAARHGFDRAQVRQYVSELSERLRRAETERAEAQEELAELRGELELARREITALSERLDAVSTPDGAGGNHAARLLQVAKSQATELTARARAAAEDSWATAEQASSELRERYRRMLSELDAQHAEIHAAHKSIMETARVQAEEMTVVAERRRREIDSAAERDRIQIEQEFTESVNNRRAELDQEVAEKLRAADEEAARRVDSVTAQVDRLTEVRTKLADQLRGSRELLDRSATLLEPAPDEQELAEGTPVPATNPPGPPAAQAPSGQPAAQAPPGQPASQPTRQPNAQPADPAAGQHAAKHAAAKPPAASQNGDRPAPPLRAKRTQAAKRG